MRCACSKPHWHEGRIVCGCGCSDNAERVFSHRRERIYLGPKTGEIVLHIHRNPFAGLYDNLNVTLKIRRHRCPERDECGVEIPRAEAELKPYASDKAAYHFLIEGEFFTNPEKFPKGFYIGELLIDDCVVDVFEIVKAPGVWVGEAIATTGLCFETKVFKDDLCPVEDCEKEKEPDCHKPCEPRMLVAKRKVNEKYVPNLDDLFEEE